MGIVDFKTTIIPVIKTFCGVPVIEADQTGDKPDGAHATFKITMSYGKGVGQAEEHGAETQTEYHLERVESFKRVLSFTAYDLDTDVSVDLAQSIHDWFLFHGYDFLSTNNIVVVDATDVYNRDAFIVDGYERRNGFDVTLRMTRVIEQTYEYIETAEINGE